MCEQCSEGLSENLAIQLLLLLGDPSGTLAVQLFAKSACDFFSIDQIDDVSEEHQAVVSKQLSRVISSGSWMDCIIECFQSEFPKRDREFRISRTFLEI